jgi:hypothetical protein
MQWAISKSIEEIGERGECSVLCQVSACNFGFDC